MVKYTMPSTETKTRMEKSPACTTFWTSSRREAIAGWFFLAPEFIGILLFGVFPILFSLYLSFCDWNLVGGLSTIRFVGLDNFRIMLEDEKFYMAVKNNLFYTVMVVPFGLILSLLLAVLIQSSAYFKSYFKVAFFIPYISSIIALGAVWSALYHPSSGPVNQMLMRLGISDPPKWLADTDFSLLSIIIIAIWAALGYQIIIYIAGLSNIPDELYEAASIDGAGSLQKFFSITIPMLGPTLTFLFITTLMSSFKVFDLVSFLTSGGPNNSSTVLVYRIYEEGFRNFRMGYASALSWVLFLIVGILTLVSARVQNRTVNE
jgi:multiple sugar transport system permease protein